MTLGLVLPAGSLRYIQHLDCSSVDKLLHQVTLFKSHVSYLQQLAMPVQALAQDRLETCLHGLVSMHWRP